YSLRGENSSAPFPAVNANEKSIPVPETLSIHTSITIYTTKRGDRIETCIFDSTGANESVLGYCAFMAGIELTQGG
ncbi:MAG: hypothetical protein IJQ58_02840, partial [Synergistaceae bacterium]|nr:hypothetical protein [Synergistaceae bacterium]